MRNNIDNIDALYYTIKALRELLPSEARFSIAFKDQGKFDYSGITITTDHELPSEEVLLNKIDDIYDADVIRLAATKYQKQRSAEYPDFRDYLDGIVKGDQGQVQAYIDACLAIKAKYPKP